jgi:C-terminal processing protease CtpA/Prc
MLHSVHYRPFAYSSIGVIPQNEIMKRGYNVVVRLSLLCALAMSGPLVLSAPQEKLEKIQRDRAYGMLEDVTRALKKNYYDPAYHGVDLEGRLREAREEIEKATSLGQTFGAIAVAIEGLNDSHTRFYPPERPLTLDYGYRLLMNGHACLVSEIRPKSDAAAKLHPGDQVLTMEGFSTTRESLVRMDYFFSRIYPRAVMRLEVRDPNGAQRQVEVQAATRPTKHVYDLRQGVDIYEIIRGQEAQYHQLRQRHVEMGQPLMIWQMPEFNITEDEVDRMWGEARKHAAVILDLRNNPGGYVTILERMIGNVIDHDVKVADRKGRNGMKPLLAKTRGAHTFSGKLIVLINSSSASAAELFSRVIQLEHRGIIVGDRSAGMVMESKFYPMQGGLERVIIYGAAITDADLIMQDGRSLEGNGVIPDELVLPSPEDLAAERDPVLAHAADVAAVKLDPVDAGKIFPFEWLPL